MGYNPKEQNINTEQQKTESEKPEEQKLEKPESEEPVPTMTTLQGTVNMQTRTLRKNYS